MTEKPCEGEGANDQADGHEGALETAMGAMIEAMLEKGDDFTKPHDGMW